MTTVTAVKLARALNLSEQRIHQLVREGLPKEARGQYDAVKCMLWYIRYLQSALKRREVPLDGEYLGAHKERVRLLCADADLREMELAEKRGQMVAIQDVEIEMTNLIVTTKARIMGIPPRVAPDLVGETSRVMIQAKIEKACKEALSALARTHNGGGNPDTSKRQHPRAISPEREGQA